MNAPLISLSSQPIVTVFGSSRLAMDSVEGRWARRLGRLLAEAGYAVCTGGYDGLMAATSVGANEAGGEVIGVTMDIFNSPANAHVGREIRVADFYQRLKIFTDHSAAYVALKGGLGTLAELALVWNFREVGLSSAPLFLQRDGWQAVIDSLGRSLVFHGGAASMKLIQFVDLPEEVVARLKEACPISC